MQRLLNSLVTTQFIPHGHCYLWKPGLVGLHVVSDVLIALAYFAIPVMLLYFVRNRRDLPFSWIFVLFGLFIVSCGTTHVMGVWTLWHPTYWLSGAIKAITALASVSTATLLVPLIPLALSLPSPAQLEAANRELKQEIEERQRSQQELQVSEERFRLLVEGVKDYAIFVLDPQGHVTSWNAGAESIKGYRAEEILSQKFSCFYTSEDILAGKPESELEIATATGRYEEEGWRRRKDGTLFWAHVVITALWNPEGQLRGFSKVTRDITQRKQAEEERQRLNSQIMQQAKLLEAILSASPDLIYMYDQNGRYLYASLSGTRALGLKPTEMLGKTRQEIGLPSLSMASVDSHRQVVFQTGQSVTDEIDFLTADGMRRYEYILSPVSNTDGQVEAVVSTARDITERKQAQIALQEQSQLLDLAYDTIMVRDVEGIITFWNYGAQEMYGWTKEEALGKSSHTLLQTEFPQALEEIEAILLSQGRWEGELRHTRRDGTHAIVASRWALQRDESGNMKGVLEINNDISDRKQMEEALHKEQEFLKVLLNNVKAGIVACDDQGVLTLFNQAARDFHGLSEQPLPVDQWATHYQLYLPDEKTPMRKEDIPLFRAFQGEYLSNVEMVVVPKQGEAQTFLASGQALFDTQGEKLGAVVVMHDITERKQAEAALLQARDELEIKVKERTTELISINKSLLTEISERQQVESQLQASLQEKEVLLKEIHHRVKNNLQIISSLLNLQADYLQDKQALEIFKVSQSRIDSMALVHEKLYQSPNLAKINFGEYIQDLVASLFSSYEINREAIALKISVDEVLVSLDISIPCGLIMNELVLNAMKHAFPDGRAGEIRVIGIYSEPNNQLTLIVKDNGIGWPQSYDFRNTESLGLQLVTTLINQLKGTLELDTSRGVEFKMKFPVK